MIIIPETRTAHQFRYLRFYHICFILRQKSWLLMIIISDCDLTPTEHFFSYIIARTCNGLMLWWYWCFLCTRPRRLVGLIFIVLVHWKNSPWIDMSFHSDTLSWLRANQYLLFLLNAAWLAEKQQIPILLSLDWPDRGSNLRSTALEPRTLTVTPPMRISISVLTWFFKYKYITEIYSP